MALISPVAINLHETKVLMANEDEMISMRTAGPIMIRPHHAR